MAPPTIPVPGRDTYWKELDSDGKIERMRNMVKGLTRKVKDMDEINDFLLNHSHRDDKVVRVSTMKKGYGTCEVGEGSPPNDEVYF